jgi:aldose 1-epimerase
MAAGSLKAPALTLFDGAAEAVVVPALGAGLASYDLVEADRRTPLFRPCRNLAEARPFDLANNLLLPWSNRISHGGFSFAGKFHALAPNLEGEPYPIHGNGFLNAWDVEAVAPAGVELSLTSNGPGPFRYAARAAYALRAGALTMSMSLVNLADARLPFGLGFHPWIVRTPETLLKAKADRVALETRHHLPSGTAPIASRPQWNFSTPSKLPSDWINNGFLGWDGRAEIVWRDRKLSLEIAADPPLDVFIVYSPSDKADFFCFEPVSHPVDAHNAAAGPEANGLAILQPGASLTATCRFEPLRID